MAEVTVAQDQNTGGKEHQKFEQTVEKIMALLQGDQSVFKNKVQNSRVDELVGTLTAKRRAKAEEDFVNEFDGLLDTYVAFQKDLAQRKQAFEKATEEKEKEFNTKANAIFGKLQDVGGYYALYKQGLVKATGGGGEQETN